MKKWIILLVLAIGITAMICGPSILVQYTNTRAAASMELQADPTAIPNATEASIPVSQVREMLKDAYQHDEKMASEVRNVAISGDISQAIMTLVVPLILIGTPIAIAILISLASKKQQNGGEM